MNKPIEGRSETAAPPVSAALVTFPSDLPTLIAVCDQLICAVRPMNPLSAYCFALGRDALVTCLASGGEQCMPRSP